MSDRVRKICGSFVIMLAVTQLYSFISAVYGYFSSVEDYHFVWNYWVILVLSLLLTLSGIILILRRQGRILSLISLLLFILYQGFTIYTYQISPLMEKKVATKMPFDSAGIVLFSIAVLLFIALLLVNKFSTTRNEINGIWKKKWRIAAFIFMLAALVGTITMAIMIFKQDRHPSTEDSLFFVNQFDGFFAIFCALLFIIFIIMASKQLSYLLIGITLGISLLYINNYLFMEQMMHYLAQMSLKIGVTEIRVLGMQLITGVCTLCAGIFQLIGYKRSC